MFNSRSVKTALGFLILIIGIVGLLFSVMIPWNNSLITSPALITIVSMIVMLSGIGLILISINVPIDVLLKEEAERKQKLNSKVA